MKKYFKNSKIKFEIQYDEVVIPEIICKCFVFNSLSFIIIVMKFAGIKAKATDMKNTKFVLFLD